MPTTNRIAGPALATGTNYQKADGTLTTTATDIGTWQRRTTNGPVRLQGAFTGGTTVVTVQSGIGPENNPGDVGPDGPGGTPGPSEAAWSVLGESENVAASLPGGVDVPVPYPWYRVKVVQSVASATAAFLSATG